MNQEDKDIRELLENFAPSQSSELDFMAHLQSRMDSVDVVKEEIAKERKRSRRAIIIAAISGMVVGILLTIAIPLLIPAIKPLILAILVAAITTVTSLGAYKITEIFRAGSPIFVKR